VLGYGSHLAWSLGHRMRARVRWPLRVPRARVTTDVDAFGRVLYARLSRPRRESVNDSSRLTLRLRHLSYCSRYTKGSDVKADDSLYGSLLQVRAYRLRFRCLTVVAL
jgi:hypothetical protein